MKLQRRCGFFKNTSILADKNSSRQLYKNLTQILVFYKIFYTFEKWFSQLNFYPIPLNTFWAEKSSQLCQSEEDFQSFMSPTTSILVGKLPSLQNVCFYTFVRSPYEFPHDQNQQWLGVLHQHLGTWVRKAYHFRSDYYPGNTEKNDSYNFEPWKGGNKHHIQLFKSFTDDSHQFRTFPEPVAFLK